MNQTLFISERSFAGQADSFHQATQLLTAFFHTIKALRLRLATEWPYRCHTELRHTQLTATLTLKEWIITSRTEREVGIAEIRKFLLELFDKGPWFDFDGAFANTPGYHLKRDNEDLTGCSIAAAAYSQGWLTCLANAGAFSEHPLQVLVNDTVGASPIEIPNFSAVSQVEALRLTYKPHDTKHHFQSTGKNAVMDLTDDEAEELLNKSVHTVGKRQRYAVKNDTVYEFQHESDRTYHGYRIERDLELSQVPLDVRERLGRVH